MIDERGRVPLPSGVLPVQHLRRLVEEGVITAEQPLESCQFQAASLDLRLGAVAHRVRASFLPGDRNVEERLAELSEYSLDLRQGAILERGVVYVIPLMETLALPPDLRAKANPRSTTGRLDVFTRTITDGSHRFEEVRSGYSGGLYLEVVPSTFAVRVRTGQSLNQIRIIQGNPELDNREMRELFETEKLLFDADGEPIDLGRAVINSGMFLRIGLDTAKTEESVAYRSRRNAAVIDLAMHKHYPAQAFWDKLTTADVPFVLQPEEFYIVGSCERIRVPPAFAAEMVAYDAFSGELRTHYAGFFDPGFGYGREGEVKGTTAVLEVRSHEVPFLVTHRQVFCRVIYERMLVLPEEVYGASMASSYQHQGLALAKQFVL